MQNEHVEDRSAHVTQLLASIRDGSEDATGQLWRVVYDELRDLADSKMRREPSGHTLQPTALVNEAFLRLVRSESQRWENRAHFFGAAAEAMRRILIDRSRRHAAAKRTPEAGRILLDEMDEVAVDSGPELLALEDALVVLEQRNERQARIVKLRFFAGLTVEQTAELLEVSRATVVNDWRFARAWLMSEMERS